MFLEKNLEANEEKRAHTVEKRIDVCYLAPEEINMNFGNPRKIGQKKKEELRQSMKEYGNFGCFIVDENNSIIAGNQRLQVLKDDGFKEKVLCKRLIGYTNAEKRSINLKANLHSGEWDLDKLADWTADLNIDLGLDLNNENPDDREIPEMELIRYEKYDYVMIVCRSELDYNDLVRKLGIEGKKVAISKRKINARAVWYDKMAAKLVPNEEYEALRKKAGGRK